MSKKFQKASEYAEYDVDGDGIITDDELAKVQSIKESKSKFRKNWLTYGWE